MNRWVWTILCFILFLCLTGCGSADSDAPDRDKLVKDRATIAEVQGNEMLVRTEAGAVMSVPAKYLEGKAEPKVGMIIEITAANEILEIYPSMYARIENIEVVGYEELEEGSQGVEIDNETDKETGKGTEQGHEGWERVVIAPVEGSYCNISLQLPESWGFSWLQSEDMPVSCISLGIYPKKEGEKNGSIVIQYAEGFGVCGTGLESVETAFNGHTAEKGIYDGHPYWDFIALSNDYRGCVIMNNAGETWFRKYEKELEEILATVEFQLSDGTSLQ